MCSSWVYCDWSLGFAQPLLLPRRPLVLDAAAVDYDELFTRPQTVAGLARRQAAAWRLLAAVAAREPPVEQAIEPRIATVLAWCERHLAEPIGRERMAALAGLSPTRFHAVFKAALGVAPLRWLAGRRLVRAQQLLLSSELPIGVIAERCGFASSYYFSRVFHQACGQTPSGYRAKHAPEHGQTVNA